MECQNTKNVFIGLAVFVYLIAMVVIANYDGIGQGAYAIAEAEQAELDTLAEKAGWDNVVIDGMSTSEFETYKVTGQIDGVETDLTDDQQTQFDEGVDTFKNVTKYTEYDNIRTTLREGDDTEDAFSRKTMYALAGGAGLAGTYHIIKGACGKGFNPYCIVWPLLAILFIVLGVLGTSAVGRSGVIVFQALAITVLSFYAISKTLAIPGLIQGKEMEYEENGRLKVKGDRKGLKGFAKIINWMEGNTKEDDAPLAPAPVPASAPKPEAQPVQSVFTPQLETVLKPDGLAYARRRLVTMDAILASTQF